MQLDERAAQHEADAEPVFRGPGHRAVLAEEAEDRLVGARPQPAAFVAHLDLHGARGGAHFQDNAAAVGRELRCVVQQVLQHLHEARVVARHDERLVGHLHVHVLAAR